MFTMLMSRNDGTEDSSGGVFTIGESQSYRFSFTSFEHCSLCAGEPLPQYTNVTAQPVLPIVNTTDGRQHWTLPLDGMKVNGKWYNTRCGLPRFCVHVCSPQHSLSGQHNLTAVLDTGTPLSAYRAF